MLYASEIVLRNGVKVSFIHAVLFFLVSLMCRIVLLTVIAYSWEIRHIAESMHFDTGCTYFLPGVIIS